VTCGDRLAAAQDSLRQEQFGDARSRLNERRVTARRKAESLQDVPQTVNAIMADALEKLNLQRFDDLQSVVPGLTLTGGNLSCVDSSGGVWTLGGLRPGKYTVAFAYECDERRWASVKARAASWTRAMASRRG